MVFNAAISISSAAVNHSQVTVWDYIGRPTTAKTGKGELLMPKKLLMIIQDEYYIAELVKEIAGMVGNYDTEIYLDGNDAMKRILLDPAPSIVFLSLYLPHTGGEPVLKAIQANAKWKKPRIYMITSNDSYYRVHKDDKGSTDGILLMDNDLWDNVTQFLTEHAKLGMEDDVV